MPVSRLHAPQDPQDTVLILQKLMPFFAPVSWRGRDQGPFSVQPLPENPLINLQPSLRYEIEVGGGVKVPD